MKIAGRHWKWVTLSMLSCLEGVGAEPVEVWPEATWPAAAPAEVGLAADQLERARDYALSGEGSGCVTRHGRLVLQWGPPDRLYDLKSTSKSIGITRRDLRWRANAYRPHQINGIERREFGSGFSANVMAMARIGLLYLREGRWRDQQLLPRGYVAAIPRMEAGLAELPVDEPENYGRASARYHWLWWNNADGSIPHLPRDAFWSWGLYDSLIVVVPSLDLVVARAGKSWPRQEGADHYAVLEGFLTPLALAAKSMESKPPELRESSSGVPPSPVVQTIEWAPVREIVREASGSDNWPITWAEDDQLYTAYGDGHGFAPFVPEKLSLGLCRLSGPPGGFAGTNLRAPSLEARGDGARGRKASGVLSVKGDPWRQTGPGEAPRFAGGFGIFDAPEPWGPWTEVFWTDAWDVGPGETQHLPTKWMGPDGHTIHLVFSGDDAFSVRRGTLALRHAPPDRRLVKPD